MLLPHPSPAEAQTALHSLPSLSYSPSSPPPPPPPQGLSHADGRPLFVFEAYEGLRTVESLDQSYLFVPAAVKEVYLARLLASLLPASETSACALPPAKHTPPADHMGARSVIVFTSSCQ